MIFAPFLPLQMSSLLRGPESSLTMSLCLDTCSLRFFKHLLVKNA